MVDWKVRSKVYHMMTAHQDRGDDLNKEVIIEEWDIGTIFNRAKVYPIKQSKELYYPAKSYAIAITYASLLQKHFNVDFFKVLDDPDLLPNDPYFKPYSQNLVLYNNLIPCIVGELNRPERHCENYKLTIDYFYKEFLLHDDTRHFLS